MADIEQIREKKQAYLRENVDVQDYEQFADFCTAYAGSIDIDAWDLQYIQQLVARFKDDQINNKAQEQEEGHLQKSFAIYQSMPGIVPQVIGSVLQVLNNNENQQQTNEPVEKAEQPPQRPFGKKKTVQSPQQFSSPQQKANMQRHLTPEKIKKASEKKQQVMKSPIENHKNSAEKQKGSAVDLLDSVFEEVDMQQKEKMDQSVDKISKSFFNSVQFWDVPQVNDNNEDKKNKKVEQHKKQISNVTSPGSTDRKNQVGNDFFCTGFPSSKTFQNDKNNDNNQFNTFSLFTQSQIKKQGGEGNSERTRKKAETVAPAGKKIPSVIKIKQIKRYDDKGELKSISKISQSQQGSISTMSRPQRKSRTSKILQKIKYDGPVVIKNNFNDSVACIKSAKRPTHDLDIKATVISHEVIQRSIFAADYIMYSLKIAPQNTILKRNYEDFVKLKSTLKKLYPGIQMPYLEKEGWISTTTQQYAQKQGLMLQYFLSDILSNRQLRNSRIVQDFLGFPDHKKMKRKFEQYDKMIKINSIEELCLLQGKVDVSLTQQQRQYKQNALKLHEKIQSGLEKYKKQCQQLSSSYQHIMQVQLNICDTLKEIQQSLTDFNRRISIKELENIDQSVRTMRITHKQNYFRNKFEKKMLDTQILPFIRYEKQNIHECKQIIDDCNHMTNKYLKRSQHETATSTGYLNKSLASFKHGILDQSKNLTVFKYQVGYMQAQTSNEIKRIFQHLAMKINKKWGHVAQKYLEQFSKSNDVWAQII